MTTTLAEAPRIERTSRETSQIKPNASVPCHVAIVLNSCTEHGAVPTDLAFAALRSIVVGCVERGIALLTLIRPTDGADTFDAAIASVRAHEPRANNVKLNLISPRNGREELLESVRRLAAQAQRHAIAPEKIVGENIENNLSTHGLPPIDLLIATGGGGTLSGALLWQSAYAELLFVDVEWHHFASHEFNNALADYATRCRKFGGLA